MKHSWFKIGVVKRKDLKGGLFVLPWVIGFCVFFLSPLAQSVIFSLNEVVITSKGRRMIPVGFDNYIRILAREVYFTERLRTFFVETLLSLPLILVFSLMIALLINQKIKFKGFFRTLFFLPIIVVSGPVLDRLIAEGSTTVPMIRQYGIYDIVGMYLPYFLQEPVMAIFQQLILILWYSGVPILIFMTGLQKIDRALYQAALIDGASSWVAFWKITLPALKTMTLLNAMYVLVFLATSEINQVIILIRDSMLSSSGGYGVASAMAWAYSILIALMMGVCYFIIGRQRKAKEKHAYIVRREGYGR